MERATGIRVRVSGAYVIRDAASRPRPVLPSVSPGFKRAAVTRADLELARGIRERRALR